MKTYPHHAMLLFGCLALAGFAVAENEVTNRPPTLADWQALAKLPDLSGVWTPVISDQVAQERTNPPLRDGSRGGGLRSVTLTATGQKLTASFGDSEKPGLK